jgi:hypothetical protein
MLEGDPDREFLLQGIRQGFHILDQNSKLCPAFTGNYSSATCPDNIDKVEAQIIIEMQEGRYLIAKEQPSIISALGAIPKVGSDEVRIIHDCSRPLGGGVNDYATLGEKLSFQTVDDATKLLDKGSFMAKVDLKSAYRSVRIHPDDYAATGLQWKFKGHNRPTTLYDTRLPFGSRLAPSIFHRLTQAVKREMEKQGFHCVAFPDDFLLVEETFDRCLQAQNALVNLLRELGFSISWNKVEGPTQKLVFLGIGLDSNDMQLELPQDKINDLVSILNSFRGRHRASLRQLQCLAGKLNFACRVVRGGRTYLRRVLDVMGPLKKPNHKAKLSIEFHKDVSWWLAFLPTFNGRTVILR